MTNRLLTVREAAEELGRSTEWTRMMMASGSIPGARQTRRRWYVPEDSLRAWVHDGCPEAAPTRIVIPPRRVLPLRGRRAA